MKILIENGRVIDPANNIDRICNLAIDHGQIDAIFTDKADLDFTPDRTIDASGLIVTPGFVDLGARLREPGDEHRSFLKSELNAALAGGVTSLVCPPDTEPVLDEPGLVEMLKYRASALNKAHIYPLGALTIGLKGEKLTEMSELTDAGCVGFSNANAPLPNTEMLLRVMQYAKSFDFCIWLQPQDPSLGKNGMAHSGALSARLGLSGIPVIAETISLHTIFELMRITGARVHLCRLSSAAGIELVRQAKAEGLPVTADAGIHHLHLTDADIDYFDSNARLIPPLRSDKDRQAITAALKDGTLDAICSDHTPTDDDEKLLPFGEAAPGATGLELLLSLTLKWANENGGDDALSPAIAKITSEPARILGLPCGTLDVGSVADVCLFDPKASWTVEAGNLLSQGRHTPFLGREIPGRIRMTLVDGQIVFER
ncbi:MAG: dihydroorotase [Oxalobacter sp.]|nr:dihydroorotase [Oxalobacter sp.]